MTHLDADLTLYNRGAGYDQDKTAIDIAVDTDHVTLEIAVNLGVAGDMISIDIPVDALREALQ